MIFREEYLVQINYKSGHRIVKWFTHFNVTKDGANLTSAKWTCAGEVRFLHIGIEEIESIVQLKSRKRLAWG